MNILTPLQTIAWRCKVEEAHRGSDSGSQRVYIPLDPDARSRPTALRQLQSNRNIRDHSRWRIWARCFGPGLLRRGCPEKW